MTAMQVEPLSRPAAGTARGPIPELEGLGGEVLDNEVLGNEALGTSSATSVGKALQILDAFRGSGSALGVSELSRCVGVPKSTTFRLLASLEQGGFVVRTGTKYKLSRRVFELGNRVDECLPSGLRDVALPFLSELFVASGRTVHMAVLDGADVVYLDKIHGHLAPPVPSTIGGRIPANCSALGKALLAHGTADTLRGYLGGPLARRTPYSITEPGRLVNQLRQIRATGEAFDREEVLLGLTCVAVPVMHRGRPVAAVSISSPTTGFAPEAYGRLLRKAASGISLALAG